MGTKLRVTRVGFWGVALAAMTDHAARAAPHEACGLLLGAGDTVREARPTANIAPDPARFFEIDPAALIAAHRAERAGGPTVLGFYHSHPSGDPVPSYEDRRQASGDGRVWAIVAAGDVRCWRDCPQGFEALGHGLVEG
jgi:proteasome lid subunit RPN8/RPN11